jgi:hypothetical protein
MKTIKSLDEIKNTNSKVYVRWSQSIALDNKRGYSRAYGTSAEAGLSCCEIDKSWEDWRILRQIAEYGFVGGDCWVITGHEVGVGADNEPLLSDVKLVGKVSGKLLATDWQAMRKDVDIADYQERLTRITDPIGKGIIEKALSKLLGIK